MNWDNIINQINKRLQSIAEHMSVDSYLYNQYASIIDASLDYDYRADGTIRIKRNKANKNPNPYQMSAYKQLLDLGTYRDALKEAKDKLDDQQDLDDEDVDSYGADDLLRDMDFVKANLDAALSIVYNHMTDSGANEYDLDLIDALQEDPKPSYRRLAELMRRVFEHANDVDDNVFDFDDLEW